MMSTGDVVLAAALELPPESRATLVEKLLESLESPDQATITAAWAQEAERRVHALDSGRLSASPIEDVLKALRQPGAS